MAHDPNPSLLLGRPCYHGVETCEPVHWTLGRYSEAVVESLVAAFKRVVSPDRPVVLIGHSGGGTLAMLMAPRLPQVEAVVTVAGNLDVAAFTEHHGFGAFTGSLDPAALPPLPERVRQMHLVGGRDEVVPPAIVEAAIRRQPGARRVNSPENGHNEGWVTVWPNVLEVLEDELGG